MVVVWIALFEYEKLFLIPENFKLHPYLHIHTEYLCSIYSVNSEWNWLTSILKVDF